MSTANLDKLAKNIEEVASKLKEKILSPDICKKLSEVLEKASLELQDLEDDIASLEASAAIKVKELQEKIIGLYGEIETHHFDYEVDQIVKNAQALEKTIKEGNMAKVPVLIEDLKELLSHFHANYRPAGINFRLVSSAENYVNKVKALLAKSKGQSKETTIAVLRKAIYNKEAA